MTPRPGRRPSSVDPARRAAYDALDAVWSHGAYANLATPDAIARHGLSGRDAAFTTALVAGTCRLLGTHERIVEQASGRPFANLDAPVQQVLLLASQQLLAMDVATHAAVATSVDLARAVAGERVTGLVNAVCRRIAARNLDGWIELLTAGETGDEALATRTHHPVWIAAVVRALLGHEAEAALPADNEPAAPTLVVRPGLASRDDLPGTPTRWSPFGAHTDVPPGQVPAVRRGAAGVQDEGSQLVAWALSRVPDVPDGPWLDLCAGPGGKAALLTGLAREAGTWLLANEAQPHRATLVRQALAAYPDGHQVTCGDGRVSPWQSGRFARVMCDVPCTGLGALRRRPESRWRHQPADLDDLVPLQRALLASAIEACAPGGVVAYVTCSPHPNETVGVVSAALDPGVELLDAPSLLPVPDARRAEDPRMLQLWPHRHGTDAMFLALLRKR